MANDRQLDALIDSAVVADLWGERGSRLDGARRHAVLDALKARLRGDRSIPVDVPLDETDTLRRVLHSHATAVASPESLLDARLAVDMALDVVVAEAIERRIAELEATALVDPLTGLGNRRAAQRAFEAALAYRDRHDGLVAVALADLVGLKRINDERGHAAGDAALKAFADALTRSMRTADSAFRYGGDEFVVLAPGATSAQLAKLFDRVRADAPEFTVGIADAPADGATELALIATADDRMYAQRRHHPALVAPAVTALGAPIVRRRQRRARVGALALLLLLAVVGPVVAQTRQSGDDRVPAATTAPTTTTAPALAAVTDPPRSGTSIVDETTRVGGAAEHESTTTTTDAVAPVAVREPIVVVATVPVVAPAPVEAPAPAPTAPTTPPVDDGQYEAADDDHPGNGRGKPDHAGKPNGNGNGGRGKR